MKNKNIFISYCWESDEHIQWVLYLYKKLRDNGINAKIDQDEINHKTINLNTFMLNNIKDNDYVLVILTPTYAQKANNLEGGVGEETKYLISNKEKVIPILNDTGLNKDDSIPFYLKGYSYIDFTKNDNFDKSLEQLIRKIEGVNLYKEIPLGKKPKIESHDIKDLDNDIEIPNLKIYKSKDKHNFLIKTFDEVIKKLDYNLKKIVNKNSDFEYDKVDISNYKKHYGFTLESKEIFNLNIWIGKFTQYSDYHIMLSYNTELSENSFNDYITCELDTKTNSLTLKAMTLSFYSDNQKINDAQSLTKFLIDKIIINIKNRMYSF